MKDAVAINNAKIIEENRLGYSATLKILHQIFQRVESCSM